MLYIVTVDGKSVKSGLTKEEAEKHAGMLNQQIMMFGQVAEVEEEK